MRQLRVGLRRLRTALRELAGFASGIDPAWEAALRTAFQALRGHRDDVTALPVLRKEMALTGVDLSGLSSSLPPASSPQAVVQVARFRRALLSATAFCQAALALPS